MRHNSLIAVTVIKFINTALQSIHKNCPTFEPLVNFLLINSPKLMKTEHVNSGRIPNISYLLTLLVQLVYPFALTSLLLQIFFGLYTKISVIFTSQKFKSSKLNF